MKRFNSYFFSKVKISLKIKAYDYFKRKNIDFLPKSNLQKSFVQYLKFICLN